MNYKFPISSCLIAVLVFTTPMLSVSQQRNPALKDYSDPRGEPELIVCSQNLANFGLFTTMAGRIKGFTTAMYREKIEALATRFQKAGCDVVAVQEVLGRDSESATAGLVPLLNEIRHRTNRFFVSKVAATGDGATRVGYLVATDRAEILNTLSYDNVELPKTTKRQKPRFFLRAPFEIQLSVKARADSEEKTVTLINFHFKSKAGKSSDPTGLEFETYRMEMAEGLRRIVEDRHSDSFASGESPLLIMGDRNSNFDSASARILEGVVNLKSFQGAGYCRLTDRAVPVCRGGNPFPQRLFSVVFGDRDLKSLPGTFTYKNSFSWIDEIDMPAESLRLAWKRFDSEGSYASGVVYLPKEASDHALVYVKLNW